MKKKLLSAAFALASILTVSTAFAGTNSAEKKLAVATGTTVTTVDKGTIVKNGNTTTAYNKNGAWVYTIQMFSADNLPKDIFDIVRNNYGSCYINGIKKVEQPGSEPVFFVQMENNTSVKTIKVINGETEVTNDFLKQ